MITLFDSLFLSRPLFLSLVLVFIFSRSLSFLSSLKVSGLLVCFNAGSNPELHRAAKELKDAEEQAKQGRKAAQDTNADVDIASERARGFAVLQLYQRRGLTVIDRLSDRAEPYRAIDMWCAMIALGFDKKAHGKPKSKAAIIPIFL